MSCLHGKIDITLMFCRTAIAYQEDTFTMTNAAVVLEEDRERL